MQKLLSVRLSQLKSEAVVYSAQEYASGESELSFIRFPTAKGKRVGEINYCKRSKQFVDVCACMRVCIYICICLHV